MTTQTPSDYQRHRDATRKRISGFHISAKNAEAMIEAAEAGHMPLPELNAMLDEADADADDRDQLKNRLHKTLKDKRARTKSAGLEWEGGIEPGIDQAGAEMFHRVMEVCKRKYGARHTGTSGRLRLAICTPSRVEFRYRTAKFARVIEELRGGTIRAVIRTEFPHLGPVHICGPNGEEAAE